MRILEKIKNIFQHGNPYSTTQTIELYTHIDKQEHQIGLKNTEIEQHKETICTLRDQILTLENTIKQLGQKDQERTNKIKELQENNQTLIQNELTHLTKIQTMRQDMQTQTQFMQIVNTAVHTMLEGLAQLPDQMPSLAPEFHNTPISNVENPPYRDATQEILEQLTNQEQQKPTTYAKPTNPHNN